MEYGFWLAQPVMTQARRDVWTSSGYALTPRFLFLLTNLQQVLAKRLSHLVTLDIDEIQSKAESFCQMDNPKRENPSDAGTPRLEKAAAEISGYDRIVSNNSTGDSMDLSDVFLDLPTPHPQMPYVESGEAQMPQYETFFNSWPTSSDQASGVQSSTEAYAQTDTDQGASRVLSGPMEIPLAEAFSWPFQTHMMGDSPHQGCSGGPISVLPTVQGPLSSNDIMAFMHISPGEDPFG